MSKKWSLPTKSKYKKLQKGKIKEIEFNTSATHLQFGHYGLKLLKYGRLPTAQLESTRRMISKYIRKKEKVWIRCIPDVPITAKPTQIRMGKGKGNVDKWVYRVKAGKVLIEISKVVKEKAVKILKSAANKLGFPTHIITRPYRLK